MPDERGGFAGRIEVAGEYVVFREGEPVAALMPAEPHRSELCDCLQERGYQVMSPEEVIDSHGECALPGAEEATALSACEARVALELTQDLAREAGASSAELDTLLGRRFWPVPEVRRALETTRDRLQGEDREKASEAIGFLFDRRTAADPLP